jgi:hypothetical protein
MMNQGWRFTCSIVCETASLTEMNRRLIRRPWAEIWFHSFPGAKLAKYLLQLAG